VHSSDSKEDSNYKIKQTKPFVDYLKENGYSVSEKQLGLFRFTANKLTGNLDHFLNQGMGSANCPTITSNSFSNSNDFRVLLYFFNASKKSSSSE
jgi:hypothetical protein